MRFGPLSRHAPQAVRWDRSCSNWIELACPRWFFGRFLYRRFVLGGSLLVMGQSLDVRLGSILEHFRGGTRGKVGAAGRSSLREICFWAGRGYRSWLIGICFWAGRGYRSWTPPRRGRTPSAVVPFGSG